MSNPEFEAWFATPAATLAGYENGWKGIAFAAWCAARDAMATSPVDMVLHCTACGLQHIDAPETLPMAYAIGATHFSPRYKSWDNPPHRSHKCHGCGHIWRPADVPTNGVAAVKTKGKADSPIVNRTQLAAAPDVEAFLDDVRAELVRARAKFPGDRITTIALAEEFGELCKAVLDEPAANVRKEGVQTAVMAARVVLDGDSSVREWRAGKGLDPIGPSEAKDAGHG
tara:strand:- start:1652 stop:2332 length:681 start_codon:yes stop_codon:yes gene_type:complete